MLINVICLHIYPVIKFYFCTCLLSYYVLSGYINNMLTFNEFAGLKSNFYHTVRIALIFCLTYLFLIYFVTYFLCFLCLINTDFIEECMCVH